MIKFLNYLKRETEREFQKKTTDKVNSDSEYSCLTYFIHNFFSVEKWIMTAPLLPSLFASRVIMTYTWRVSDKQADKETNYC